MIQRTLRKLASPVLMFSLVAVFLTFSLEPTARAGAQQKRRARAAKAKTPAKPKVDYTKFSHTTHVVAQKLACNSCHQVPAKNWKDVRKGDAAFADVTD